MHVYLRRKKATYARCIAIMRKRMTIDCFTAIGVSIRMKKVILSNIPVNIRWQEMSLARLFAAIFLINDDKKFEKLRCNARALPLGFRKKSTHLCHFR